jgi:hypothetical protein
MWQQWTNALLGLAVIAVPFLGLTGDAFMWTLSIIGIAIAVLGAWGAITHDQMTDRYSERMT